MKSLFRTVALITVFSFLTRVSGFIFRIILSRVVGAEGVGLYQVASSVFFVLLTVISSGIPLIISRKSASFSVKKEKKKQGSYLSVALIYTLTLSLILVCVVLLFKGLFSKIFTDQRCYELLLVLLPSLVFSSVYCVFRGSLWGQGNYFALCISEFYEQVVHIIAGVFLIGSSLSAIENAFGISLSMSIACFLSMILVVLLFFYYGGSLSKPKKEYLKPLVKQSTPITVMRVVGSFLQPLIALIIPARLISIGYTSSQALSLYGIAVGMTLPLIYVPTTIIGSLSTALVPDISKAVAQNDKSHIEKRITTSIYFALIISSLFVPLYLGAGEQIGLFLYDNILSGTLLQSASWVLLPLGLTNISSALLNSLGYENRSFVNFFVGAVAMFLALWILPTFVGVNSIIWAMGINYCITAILNLWLLKRKTKLSFKVAYPIIKIILLIIPSSALTAFVVSLSSYAFPLFISLVIGGVIGVGSYVLLASVAGIIDLKVVLTFVKEKFDFKRAKKAKQSA